MSTQLIFIMHILKYVNETLNGASIGAYHFQSCQCSNPVAPFCEATNLLHWRDECAGPASASYQRICWNVNKLWPPCPHPVRVPKVIVKIGQNNAKYWSWGILLIYFWIQIRAGPPVSWVVPRHWNSPMFWSPKDQAVGGKHVVKWLIKSNIYIIYSSLKQVFRLESLQFHGLSWSLSGVVCSDSKLHHCHTFCF